MLARIPLYCMYESAIMAGRIFKLRFSSLRSGLITHPARISSSSFAVAVKNSLSLYGQQTAGSKRKVHDDSGRAGDLITPSKKLNNGEEMPLIGLGTWLSPKNEAGEAVKYALEIGYKHIDCAHRYENEAEIGEYMSQVFKTGKVKRDEVFITSKLWATDLAKEDVIPACKLTLKNLKLDYLDLYMVHHSYRLVKGFVGIPEPCSGKGLIGYTPGLMQETWKEMEKLVEMGLVKGIGVSNFTRRKISDLLHFAEIKPAVNQVELNPYLPQHKLKEYCDELDISFIGFSPLGNPTRPKTYIQASDPVLLEEEVIKKIAEKHKCTPAQVLVKWGTLRGTAVIPKSTIPSEIKENLESVDVKLDQEDMEKIYGIKTRFRHIPHTWTYFPNQTDDEVWDAEYLG